MKQKRTYMKAITAMLLCVLVAPVVVADDPGIPETFTVPIGEEHLQGIYFEEGTGEEMVFFNESGAPDSGYIGCSESLEENLFASSILYIHTCANNHPPLLQGKFIYADLFIRDVRTDRTKAYMIFETIDLHKKINNEWKWVNGPMLYGRVVMENEVLPRTHIGSYGSGAVSDVDKILFYRINIISYKEVSRDEESITFERNQTVTSNVGLWFFDVPPFRSDSFKCISLQRMMEEQQGYQI